MGNFNYSFGSIANLNFVKPNFKFNITKNKFNRLLDLMESKGVD